MKELFRWITLLSGPLVIGLGKGYALPSFARQLDTQCIQCHTEFPILTEFGRQFKLSGYTMDSPSGSDLPPIAIMLQPSFTHTAQGQPGGAAPGFRDNDNVALTQASIFYAGRLFGPYADHLFGGPIAAFLDRFGIFSQVTYDGVAKSWTWDNLELRYAAAAQLAGKSVSYGFYLNNNPTLQDPWNTLPAWGFPFSGSGVAPTPSAAALIDGGLAQQVAGFGAYALWADSIYVDLGAYRTLGAHFQRAVGVDPTGETEIAGLAPYWRLAWSKEVDGGTWEVGSFGLAAPNYPGRNQSAGRDFTTDVGVDTEYQRPVGKHDPEALVSYIEQMDHTPANRTLGAAATGSSSLSELKVTLTDLYDKTYGLSAQYFYVSGSHDSQLYPGNAGGSPLSDGFVLQLDYLPFNKLGGPPSWPRSNLKLSLQYVAYDRFNGSRTNIDGQGRTAANNNTLYLEAWIDF